MIVNLIVDCALHNYVEKNDMLYGVQIVGHLFVLSPVSLHCVRTRVRVFSRLVIPGSENVLDCSLQHGVNVVYIVGDCPLHNKHLGARVCACFLSSWYSWK